MVTLKKWLLMWFPVLLEGVVAAVIIAIMKIYNYPAIAYLIFGAVYCICLLAVADLVRLSKEKTRDKKTGPKKTLSDYEEWGDLKRK